MVEQRMIQWTGEISDSHTGDTNWQTLINEGAGAGFAWVNASVAGGVAAGEVRVTIDGGSAMTMTVEDNDTTCSFPIQYSSSLLVEYRVNDIAKTIYIQAWWNNA